MLLILVVFSHNLFTLLWCNTVNFSWASSTLCAIVEGTLRNGKKLGEAAAHHNHVSQAKSFCGHSADQWILSASSSQFSTAWSDISDRPHCQLTSISPSIVQR